MAFTRGPLASAWLVTLAPIALSGLGIVSPGVLVLVFVLGGLMAAALILTLASKRAASGATTSSGARARAASDEQDLIRLDSDMG